MKVALLAPTTPCLSRGPGRQVLAVRAARDPQGAEGTVGSRCLSFLPTLSLSRKEREGV